MTVLLIVNTDNTGVSCVIINLSSFAEISLPSLYQVIFGTGCPEYRHWIRAFSPMLTATSVNLSTFGFVHTCTVASD